MKFTHWLRQQVTRLENEIREHDVFDSDLPATPATLAELRTKVVLHTYLKQQLLRREVVEFDTNEFELVLVRRA